MFRNSSAFDDSPGRRGLFASLGVHILFVLICLLGQFRGDNELSKAPVYSVTLEGGSKLGGRSQVAETKKQTPQAPPKNVGSKTPTPTPVPKQQVEPKKNEPKVPVQETKKDDIKTGEEKKEEVIKPKPTPVAVPEKKPTPKPEPTAKPQPKSTPTPEAKQKPQKPVVTPPKKKPENLESQYERAMQRYLGESSDAGGDGFGAARVGGRGMGGGVIKPPEFFQYLALLKRELKSGWQWYSRRDLLIAEVELKIARNGSILDERIVKGSGNREFDSSVLRAVRKSDPLPPPPTSVYDDFKVVRIIFDPRD
jgi:colicin import membrane protein